jgi:hypothetical protein
MDHTAGVSTLHKAQGTHHPNTSTTTSKHPEASSQAPKDPKDVFERSRPERHPHHHFPGVFVSINRWFGMDSDTAKDVAPYEKVEVALAGLGAGLGAGTTSVTGLTIAAGATLGLVALPVAAAVVGLSLAYMLG